MVQNKRTLILSFEMKSDKREDVMRQVYTGTFKSKKQARNRDLVQKMKTRFYDDFVARTSMGISILGCRYMGRKCTRDWVPRYTRYGRCFTFNPDGDGRVPEKVMFLGLSFD